MTKLDRKVARALVDAGYMPPSDYAEMYYDSAARDQRHAEASTAPGIGNQQEPLADALQRKDPS
jgi:hypothetical protein